MKTRAGTSSKLGEPATASGAAKSPSSVVREVSGRGSTTTPPKTLSGFALVAACSRELEKDLYLSELEMDYLCIYRQVFNTMSWDLTDETPSWN
jgi:hypothetical protein